MAEGWRGTNGSDKGETGKGEEGEAGEEEDGDSHTGKTSRRVNVCVYFTHCQFHFLFSFLIRHCGTKVEPVYDSVTKSLKLIINIQRTTSMS